MFEDQFRDFAAAALTIGASLVSSLDASQRSQVDAAMRGGARLSLEFGPLPEFERLELVLIEREGTRHRVAAVSVNTGLLQ